MEERRVVNETGLADFFNRVYAQVGLGIGVTGLISYLLGNVFAAQYTAFIRQNNIVFYAMTLLPLILSFVINNKKARTNAGYASIIYLMITASFGFTYASLFLIYPIGNLTAALFTTAVVFITMSVVGRTTKQDLSRAGAIAYTAIWGVILMTLVNLFLLHSSGMQLLMSYAILVIFIILTAWDNQALKRMYLTADASGQASYSLNALAVQGALRLYLDFLNLFLAIVQIFGGSDRN
ncbi:Bax inhibitor-1/YccA family protein [Lacticaseibacillus daqingensis]|uniref:Bax inhibitor-1/YccA family protein n=1 Tax=Lacticaseibacillus daqingensis TaxID=2486014 RepID=UPI000F77694A|nr:Bax inhibitor-1/YccA family protein [Lacticaseibacillus daqingensis]